MAKVSQDRPHDVKKLHKVQNVTNLSPVTSARCSSHVPAGASLSRIRPAGLPLSYVIVGFCRRLIVAEPPDEGWPEEEGDYGPEGEGPVEGERDAWFEFRSVMDAAHLSSITACAFDPFEELLWTGSAAVRTATLPPPCAYCGITGPPRVLPESRHGALHCAPHRATGDPSHTRGGGGRADRSA